MCTKLFHRLSYLLCLFQIPCFAALQTVSSHSINGVPKLECRCKKSCIESTKNAHENKLLIYGYIREELEIKDVRIPNDIKNLCFSFFDDRLTPGPCIIKDFFKRIHNYGSDKNDKISVNFNILSDYLAIYEVENVRDYEDKKTPFIWAAHNGQLDVAKLLRQRGANIEKKDKYGDNALHAACLFSGSEEMVAWLLDKCKIDIESKGNPQMTPFLYAAEKGQLAIAKLLRQRNANIYAIDENEDNALQCACLSSGSEDMVTWLLDTCKIDIESKGKYKRTPFLYAASGGNLGIAKLLRQRGANIHAKDKQRNNALHVACAFSGSVAIVTWLLGVCKIGLESKGFAKNTPFFLAAAYGQLKIAQLLKQRGAYIYAKDYKGNNALHLACKNSGSVEMVTWLLDECNIGIEAKGQYKNTPFLYAAQGGKVEIAKLLKQRGANIHAKNKYGYNALHYACNLGNVVMTTWLLDECKIDIESKEGIYQKKTFLIAVSQGHLAIAKLLKQRGANVEAKDKYGNNALSLACSSSGSVEMVTWLLDTCKIPIEAKGCTQNTSFLWAAQKGRLDIAKLLRQRGANIQAQDEDGNNALHAACFKGSVPMVAWLLDVCKIDIESKEGTSQRTPFLYAAWHGQLAIAKLLRQRGANIHAKDKSGKNALNLASSRDKEMIKWLLDVCKLKKKTWLNWFTG